MNINPGIYISIKGNFAATMYLLIETEQTKAGKEMKSYLHEFEDLD